MKDLPLLSARLAPLLAMVFTICSSTQGSAATLLTESFETDGEGTRYTSNTFPPVNCSVSDFFERHDFSGANPHSCHETAITGIDGSFGWASEDIGGQLGLGTPGVLTLNNLNVSANNNLAVVIGLAIGNAADQWECDDTVEIQFAFDGDIGTSTYTTIGLFFGNHAALPCILGGPLQQDLDLNPATLPTGPTLNNTLTDYTFSIPSTGTDLSVRLVVTQNGGTEEFVFDNIRITGDVAASIPPVLANIEAAAINYNEEDPATQVTGSITVSDADSTNLEGATIQISSNNDPTEDVLSATGLPAGIMAAPYDSASGTLTLSGTALVADYQAALRLVTYQNTDLDDPSDDTRTVSFTISDASGPGNTVSRDINVIPFVPTGTIPHTESFETEGEGERYTSNTFTSNCGVSDFFERHDFSGANPHPCHQTAITGIDGNFGWASEDIGGALGLGNPGILTLQNLNVSGKNNLTVAVGLAIGNAADEWECDDTVEVQYAMDGDIATSTYTTIGLFFGNRTVTPCVLGGPLQQDSDLNPATLPTGPTLNSTLTEYLFSIPSTGTDLSVRMVITQSGGTEEFVFDNICTFENNPANVIAIESQPDGSVKIDFAGIPGRNHRIQSTDSLTSPTWVDRQTVEADALGMFMFTDPPPQPPLTFYRTVHP